MTTISLPATTPAAEAVHRGGRLPLAQSPALAAQHRGTGHGDHAAGDAHAAVHVRVRRRDRRDRRLRELRRAGHHPALRRFRCGVHRSRGRQRSRDRDHGPVPQHAHPQLGRADRPRDREPDPEPGRLRGRGRCRPGRRVPARRDAARVARRGRTGLALDPRDHLPVRGDRPRGRAARRRRAATDSSCCSCPTCRARSFRWTPCRPGCSGSRRTSR